MIPPPPFLRDDEEMRPHSLVIEKATYGPADITGKVIRQYLSGKRYFYPTNQDWGDTAPDIVKNLKIRYAFYLPE